MRKLNSNPRAATTHRGRRQFASNDDGSARRLSPQLIADGVIAGYIHDISQGHRRSARRRPPAPTASRHGRD